MGGQVWGFYPAQVVGGNWQEAFVGKETRLEIWSREIGVAHEVDFVGQERLGAQCRFFWRFGLRADQLAVVDKGGFEFFGPESLGQSGRPDRSGDLGSIRDLVCSRKQVCR